VGPPFISEKRLYERVYRPAICLMQAGEKLCLWNSRALFLGSLPDLDFHQQAAALVCIALDGEFALTRENGAAVSCRSALIGPQISHSLKPRGSRCAFLFFDPDNPDYEFLTRSNDQAGETGMLVALNEEEKLRAVFQNIAACADESALRTALIELELAPKHPRPAAIDDQRIQSVMRRLVNEPGESIPIESLAREVEISPSRLAHLFKEQVGVPIRMFRTWFRLKNAVLFLKEGMTLTDAALRSGFYDSAHFTNTFRDTFGLSPSMVFSTQRKIHWNVDAGLPAVS
jgi:AraC-like DNA-binding protein